MNEDGSEVTQLTKNLSRDLIRLVAQRPQIVFDSDRDVPQTRQCTS